ncbi:MAG: septum formation inhibitor Maf, partial [Oxalobacteraceae bacterium]
PILCADTTVAVDNLILGKPQDEDDARRMLTLMSGRSHRVITAVAVASAQQRADAANVSSVEFSPLTAGQIDRYVCSREPFGKAGGYAIQSQAAAWIVRIAGSYSGIMGLPLFETAAVLAKFGFEF